MIRVLIERRIDGQMEAPYQKLMREIRTAALHVPGFVCGETLRDSTDSHHYYIISTWRTRAEWDAWALRTERLRLRESIGSMLTAPEKLTILEPL